MDITVDRALTALQEIVKANPEELTRWLYSAFGQIVKMDKDQTIAAWQTLDFCSIRFSSESEQRRIIEKFQEAIVNRMIAITNDTFHMGRSDKEKFIKPLLDVIGHQVADRFFR